MRLLSKEQKVQQNPLWGFSTKSSLKPSSEVHALDYVRVLLFSFSESRNPFIASVPPKIYLLVKIQSSLNLNAGRIERLKLLKLFISKQFDMLLKGTLNTAPINITLSGVKVKLVNFVKYLGRVLQTSVQNRQALEHTELVTVKADALMRKLR